MDVTPTFQEIGRIRKGAAKKEGEKKPGQDLTYFRFEIDKNELEAIDFIGKLYPGQPAALRIWLPFKTVDENFMYCREAYVAGGLLHRCSLWGHWEDRCIDFQRDPDGKTVINHGSPIRKCDGGPVGEWKNRDTGEMIPVFCKPVGRLKLIIPELRRMVFFTALTSSIHDIENLRSELLAFQNVGPKGLAGIPLILKRVPKKISTPSKEGRVRREKWLIHIEVDPKYAEQIFLSMTAAAMPEVKVLEAPKGISEGEWTEEKEDEEPEEFSKSIPDENFGVEEDAEPEIVYPEHLTVDSYTNFAKKHGIDVPTSGAILKECKMDLKKAWAALLRSQIPQSEWLKG
jgi:hypothetical protein